MGSLRRRDANSRSKGPNLRGDSSHDSQERYPKSEKVFVAARHIFADTALSDLDAQFEQFVLDAGCTPAGILLALSCG
jgi:hypothetical protein